MAETEFLPTGLVLPEGLSLEEWCAVGDTVRGVDRATNWWIGDWLRYGEGRYGAYSQYSVEIGRDPGTLSNLAAIASRFPIGQRRASLSWSCHRAVAYLPDDVRERLLDEAEANRWGSRDVEEAAALARQETKKQLPSATMPPRGGISDDAAAAPESPGSKNGDAPKVPDVGKSDAEPTSKPEEEAPAFDLTDALEDAQKRILALQAERDSLKTSDKDAEIAKLHERIVRLEGYQAREQNKALERERIIKAHRRTLQEAADLLGVSSFGEIVPAIRDLLR